MDSVGIFILPLIGGVVLFLVIGRLVRAPGGALQRKFVSLGTLKGKPFSEISAVVGAPNSVSATASGGKLRQWLATGYHIGLIFDSEDVCLGVSNETKV